MNFPAQGFGGAGLFTLLSTVTRSPLAVKLTGPGPSSTFANADFTCGAFGPSITTLFRLTTDRFSASKPINVTTGSTALPAVYIARPLLSAMFLNSGADGPSSLL